MTKVFISYSHSDQRYVSDIKSVRLNRNHGLGFNDKSLQEPIYNEEGHVNRRPPHDSASYLVRQEISRRLQESDKLLVLLGNDTHSKLWVEWEINEFRKLKQGSDILVMKVPNSLGGAPKIVQQEVYDWDLNMVSSWVRD